MMKKQIGIAKNEVDLCTLCRPNATTNKMTTIETVMSRPSSVGTVDATVLALDAMEIVIASTQLIKRELLVIRLVLAF